MICSVKQAQKIPVVNLAFILGNLGNVQILDCLRTIWFDLVFGNQIGNLAFEGTQRARIIHLQVKA